MRHIKPLNEKKPKGAPEFHHSDAPDAEGRFKDLGIKDLAAWLIKTRKKDVKKISGSLTQQIVFNRGDDPKYAEKMEKVRKEVYKQLDRQDLIDKMDESLQEPLYNSFSLLQFQKWVYKNRAKINRMSKDEKIKYLEDNYIKNHGKTHLGSEDLKGVGSDIYHSMVLHNIIKESVLNEEDSYDDYPAAAKKNAQMAIDWKEKYGRDEVPAGTPVGWARAHQLAKGEKISADTVKRMSAFNRHRKNSSIAPEHKDTPWKDRGYVAWLIWGGDEGVDWAIEKSKEIDAMKESKQMKYIKPLHEAKRGAIHKAAKKGSYPVSIVVINSGMVVKQELVDTPAAVPAVFNELQKQYPNAVISVESNTGETLFSESVDEAKMPKKYIGNDDIVYLKTKEDSKGAHYNLYYKGHDIDVGGRRFGSEKELEDFASNYILSNQLYKKLRYEDSIPLPESVNESLSSYEYGNWVKENGKIKFPKWIKVKSKEIIDGGFMEKVYKSEHHYMSIWLGSFDNKTRSELYAYDDKGKKEFGEMGYKFIQRFWNDITGYTMFFWQGAVAALEVSKHIRDMEANGESIEPAYYLMKEYFNNFGMETNRSRVFNAAVEKLEAWMKDNQIKTL
jgi:hypothetical protein